MPDPLGFFIGLAAGLIVGRWWAVAAPAALGLWIALTAETELSPWFMGANLAVGGAIGVGLGVLVRKRWAAQNARERRRGRERP
jgi:hypothetical protein